MLTASLCSEQEKRLRKVRREHSDPRLGRPKFAYMGVQRQIRPGVPSLTGSENLPPAPVLGMMVHEVDICRWPLPESEPFLVKAPDLPCGTMSPLSGIDPGWADLTRVGGHWARPGPAGPLPEQSGQCVVVGAPPSVLGS